MNYLFYDLECASCAGGGKICEFGYVLTDGSFRLLEKANLLINPGIGPGEWDWYALKKVLTHSRPEYEAQKKFPHYADKIRELFEGAVAVGHTIDGDAQYLLDECARYGVKAWDYRYVDIRAVDVALAPGKGAPSPRSRRRAAVRRKCITMPSRTRRRGSPSAAAGRRKAARRRRPFSGGFPLPAGLWRTAVFF